MDISALRGAMVPRVWTRPLRELTPETSAGYSVIEFAREVLGVGLWPWQEWLFIHALELREDGTFRFQTLLVLIARQNGKTTWMQVLALWRMYVDGSPLVIGTAQNLDVAEEAWSGAVELAEGVPDLADLIAHVDRTNGKKALRLETGERYKVQAASRRGGRGLSGDLVLLDELREHQTWAAWAAVTKTTMARPNPQIVGLSNAGDDTSVVLIALQAQAIAAIENGATESTSVFIAEWSASPDCIPDEWDDFKAEPDWSAIAQANPSLGYSIRAGAILAALEVDPEAVFRTEVLCQHVETMVAKPISSTAWATIRDETSRRAPGARPVLAVSVNPDRTSATLGWAARRADGRVHIEVIAKRRGVAWVPARLAQAVTASNAQGVVMDPGSPSGGLVPDVEAALEPLGMELTTTSTRDYVQACTGFLDAVLGITDEVDERGEPVVDPTVRHVGQPELDDAVPVLTKRTTGRGWMWAAMDDATDDITSIEMATLAHWGLSVLVEVEDDDSSVYEGRNMLVLG